MTDTPRWEQWRPQIAPHVLGEYTHREFDPETGLPGDQQWRVRCEKCGGVYQGTCSSGAVRSHIQRFAALHVHRDPLGAPRVERPGNLRRSDENGQPSE